jgi:DNA-directed RNA polymerase specialized sigma24 family protein
LSVIARAKPHTSTKRATPQILFKPCQLFAEFGHLTLPRTPAKLACVSEQARQDNKPMLDHCANNLLGRLRSRGSPRTLGPGQARILLATGFREVTIALLNPCCQSKDRPMSSDASVTHWLDLLKQGERAAAGPLWERYFHLLVVRARAALGTAPRRAVDEEDVALSAFDSFCRGAAQGRFPRLDDRDDLWRLLLVLTARKAIHQVRDERRARRGGGKVRTEADLLGNAAADGEAALAQVMGAEPTPELAAQVAEACRRLLAQLGDEGLRAIAVWQMEGFTVKEIAAKLDVAPRTVARKLAQIRDMWSAERLAP